MAVGVEVSPGRFLEYVRERSWPYTQLPDSPHLNPYTREESRSIKDLEAEVKKIRLSPEEIEEDKTIKSMMDFPDGLSSFTFSALRIQLKSREARLFEEAWLNGDREEMVRLMGSEPRVIYSRHS